MATTLWSPDETEVLPGVYLLRCRSMPVASLDDALRQRQGASGDLCGSVAVIEAEIQRIEVSLQHLARSNEELRSADPCDEEYQQAISENVAVMARQKQQLVRYRAMLRDMQNAMLGRLQPRTAMAPTTVTVAAATSSGPATPPQRRDHEETSLPAPAADASAGLFL